MLAAEPGYSDSAEVINHLADQLTQLTGLA
jgi:hypothetical protein